LLVEEPENGLHPGRLKEIIQVLRKVVQTQEDTQVVLTTHSPLLLDFVEPQEVRVFLRNKEKDNDIEVYNLADVPDIQERLHYLMLGELVYNEGEEELIKEIRHAHSASGGGADGSGANE
jgi:AAA15 family ATPase/GTPase